MPKVELTDSSSTRSGAIYKTMTTSVNVSVSPALPAFSEANPRAWFLLAETRFTCNKITEDVEKTGRVLEALPPHIFEKIAPWLETKLAETLKYVDLKDELLSHYTASSHSRAKQIYDMVENSTQKPSDRWRTMDALQTGSDGTKLDMTWQLWLLSLPSRVRIQVQDSTLDKAKIVRKADSLLKQIEEDDSHPVMASQRAHHKHRSRTHDDDRDKISEGLCWYHRTYRAKARQCREGCKNFSTFVPPAKNAAGDRQ